MLCRLFRSLLIFTGCPFAAASQALRYSTPSHPVTGSSSLEHVSGLALQVPVTSFPGHIFVVLQYSQPAHWLLEVHFCPSVACAAANGTMRSIAELMKVIRGLLKRLGWIRGIEILAGTLIRLKNGPMETDAGRLVFRVRCVLH